MQKPRLSRGFLLAGRAGLEPTTYGFGGGSKGKMSG
jgi:hypothetical protein